jgi:hypothetical protein
MRNAIKATMNMIFAAANAVPATTPKPSAPAIKAMTRKAIAQLNMMIGLLTLHVGNDYGAETFKGVAAQTRETDMAKDSHNTAAEHHDKAAKSHRMAAEHHGKGDHAKGREESAKAHGHSKTAHEHSETAHGKSQAQK